VPGFDPDAYAIEGTLTIGSVLMNRPAWAIVGDERGEGGLLDLLTNVEQRGEDRIVPSASGVIPYPRRITGTRHDLRLLVCGDVDVNGSPNTNVTEGLAVNLAYIYANVVTPVVSATGTRSATLAIPGLANRTANIHVVGLRRREYHISPEPSGPAIWEGNLMISIPAGRFA
jgi:hypothetical protein